ncbi:hypothetical protein, partial [Serratia marcescens]|uniref:hypothetical protein n=1 Tax=Serratia marcescens TaxID=615 RepID=UPI001953341A
ADAVFRGISKFFLLSVLIGATIWFGRTYRALKHLETINRHRANSLRTFQAFVKAASTDQIRDSVLVEAARSIFMIAPTGYVEQDTQAEQR